MLRELIEQYCNDPIGKQLWPDLSNSDDHAALRTIFLHGACFDFSGILSELSGWPVYEIQWGTATPGDPSECDLSDYAFHRVVRHPSGRYLDASGWTDMQAVLTRVERTDATFQWMGEADPDYGLVFDVDFELVKQAVKVLLPNDSGFN